MEFAQRTPDMREKWATGPRRHHYRSHLTVNLNSHMKVLTLMTPSLGRDLFLGLVSLQVRSRNSFMRALMPFLLFCMIVGLVPLIPVPAICGTWRWVTRA